MLTRRKVLGGAMAALTGGISLPVAAQVPSLRPRPRPGSASETAHLVEAAKLGGQTGFVVADARTGAVLEAHLPDSPLPPASVAKTITALYALERLGPAHRLTTRILATGPVAGGQLQGDLILEGGGDPTLDTDDLGDLAAALKAAGITRITGRFLAWGGALPALPRIAADQPDHVGYNPGLSGLILNFGRVYFEWKRSGQDYAISMDARGERFAPKVGLTRMELANREVPLFTYALHDATEDWTVARPALGRDGSRWLPVRRATAYTAEAFRGVCAMQGISLPPVEIATTRPEGTQIARHDSEPLTDLLRGMLRWSTNITAEALGLAASGAGTLGGSGRAMTEWARLNLGHPGDFVDHSGLGAGSRVTAAGMVRALVAGRAGPHGATLPAILRDVGMRDSTGKAVEGSPIRVLAKTGTLNFASGLAGFIQPPQGRELAFAIFSADANRRAALPMQDREDPPGGSAWLKRARTLQGQLIARWGGNLV